MYADRILRDVVNLMDATLRTNFHRRRDMADYIIALKISSLGVIAMPSPKPFIEIYVHSRTMEGIHLRGAKVARGGIRWSDRRDDFRAGPLCCSCERSRSRPRNRCHHDL